jgi:serpin B
MLHARRALLTVLPFMLVPLAAQTAPADARLLASACNQFAVDLHDKLAAKGAPTASPGSIALALLMVVPGARGDTEKELVTVLRLPPELRGERLHQAAKDLIAGLVIAPKGQGNDAQLRIVNDLWAQAGYPILADYSTLLRTHYGAQAREVPFASNPEAARKTINTYIANATNQRIPELLTPDLVTTDTRVVLTNAIWLKAAWQNAFPASLTKPAKFTLTTGEAIEVPTMHTGEAFAYAETDAWQCVVLPFAGCDVVAEFVLPRAGKPLADAERALLAGEHEKLLANAHVQLSMPRFRTTGAHRLRDVLIALGIRLAFTKDADFTGITPRRELVIDDVVHQTWIQVDEAGAEAAAATAVAIKRTSAPGPGAQKVFAADRPFAFTLRDRSTGLVLFLGRVEDPRANATAAQPAR